MKNKIYDIIKERKNMTGYKPQPGYILVKRIETEEKSDGLVFVDDKEKPNAKIGEVIDIGREIKSMLEASRQFTITTQDLKDKATQQILKIGDTVVYKKYVDFNFTENGEEYVFIKFEDVIAIKETK
jgi:co-chaperonin GroES (HSP10)